MPGRASTGGFEDGGVAISRDGLTRRRVRRLQIFGIADTVGLFSRFWFLWYCWVFEQIGGWVLRASV